MSRIRIADLLYAGRKIQAIKAYREITEAGLKEAKDSVEKLEQQLHESGCDRAHP